MLAYKDTIQIGKTKKRQIPLVLVVAIFSPFSIAKDVNPFTSFFGVWTLKNNEFQQVWDVRTLDTLTIENHLTDCKVVNTSKSLLCIVNEGELKGHILWVYDNDKK